MIDWDAMPPGQRSAALRKLMPLCGYERVGDCEKAKRKQQGRDTNKTEKAFGEMLTALIYSGHIIVGTRNTTAFKLAGRTGYMPDYYVFDNSGYDWFIEIKGFMRDDAAVKLKVAASLYRQYRWLLVKRGSKGEWKAYSVTAEKGISRKPAVIDWLTDK